MLVFKKKRVSLYQTKQLKLKIMKLLKTSNYDNREVINFIKTQFSTIESSKCSFTTSQFLEMDSLKVSFDGDIYKVSFENLKDKSLNFSNNITKTFENRAEAMKTILFNLGIISKSELNK